MKTSYFLDCYQKVVWLICLIAYSVLGQGKQKQMLTREDYKLWSTMTAEQFSDDGKWASYSLRYESGMDTLFVKRTDGRKTFAFPKGRTGSFNGEKWFAYLDEQQRLTVFDLEKRNRHTTEKVTRYQWIGNGKYLLLFQMDDEGEYRIIIQDTKGTEAFRVEHAITFSVSHSGELVAFTAMEGTASKCGLIDIGTTVTAEIVFSSNEVTAEQPVWDKNDKAFAFVQRKTGHPDDFGKVNLYAVESGKLSTFEAHLSDDFAVGQHISPNTELITISPDLKRVFFGLKQNSENAFVIDPTAVQIWNSADKYIYPLKAECDGWNVVDKVVVWWTETRQFRQITDNELPRMTLNSSGTYAIVHNPQAYEPQHRFYGNVDYYLTNVNTGERELLLRDFPATEFGVVFSPDGKYITYFKGRNWWVYDVMAKTHLNVTAKINVILDDEDNDRPDVADAYSRPMWSADCKYFLFFDHYDLWKVTPNGKDISRLTNGREHAISFRFAVQKASQKSGLYYDTGKSTYFDLNESLYLVARDKTTGRNGYYSWTAKTGAVSIAFGQQEINQLRTTENGDCLYVVQLYDSPPSLWMKKSGEKARKLFQSNQQHKNFYWGKSELVAYTTKKGKVLRGLLFYPANYQKDKNYPMLVEVYQNQGSDLHKYVNPSEFTRNGFNATNFTSQGYFVLMPDLFYEIGDVGGSATDCVLAAIKAVKKKVPIDAKRIGISGHSHGGYEVNFIITQTNVFAAGLSGSGVSDLSSRYLGYSRNYSRPEMWRYEYGDMRMGKSLFEDKIGYDHNSPIVHAVNIQTPLLSWTGGADTQVDPHQSIEFYLALRRLGKKNVFLVYPEEDHTLHDKRNQYDLMLKIEEWFNYYLKDGPVPKWTAPDILEY
jgi:dipeptidyl aminopeptidase/acylaminoacyl peptidase